MFALFLVASVNRQSKIKDSVSNSSHLCFCLLIYVFVIVVDKIIIITGKPLCHLKITF